MLFGWRERITGAREQVKENYGTAGTMEMNAQVVERELLRSQRQQLQLEILHRINQRNVGKPRRIRVSLLIPPPATLPEPQMPFRSVREHWFEGNTRYVANLGPGEPTGLFKAY